MGASPIPPGPEVDLEVEILLNVGVQVELALLDELHHRDVGEELRDRSRTKRCDYRIDLRLLLEVRVAVALEDEWLPVLVNRNCCARDVVTLQLQREKPVEKRGNVFRRVSWWEES